MGKSIRKILVLTTTFPRWEGDNEPAFIYELCKQLKKNNDVHVLAPHMNGALKEETMGGITVHRYQYFLKDYQSLTYEGGILARLKQNKARILLVPFLLLAQLISLVRLNKYHNFDYINAHWIIPNALNAVVLQYLTGSCPPVVCTSHGGDLFALKGQVLFHLKKWILNNCLKIIVVSEAMRKVILNMGISSEKTSVISMGVDLKNKFVPSGSVHKQENMIIFVGRLVEKKGLTHLLDAVNIVRNKHPELELIIAGDGPERAALEFQAIKLMLTENIKFIGAVNHDDLVNLYQKAEIAVFPFIVAADGDQEGLGLVVVEAMGCECAVIASDLPAVHDTVINSVNGLMVAPGNSTHLAELIDKLLDNPDYARELGKTARKSIADRFDWSIIGSKYEKLFSDLSDGI